MVPPVAALRFVRDGQVRRASPHVVVRDDEELVALHIPVGATAQSAAYGDSPIRGQADRTWDLERLTWHSYRVLRLIRWGDAHSLELFWHERDDSFAGWYVNLQEPLRRSPAGFDTDDSSRPVGRTGGPIPAGSGQGSQRGGTSSKRLPRARVPPR